MDAQAVFRRRIEAHDALLPELRRCLYVNPLLTVDMVLQDIERHPDKKHLWSMPYAMAEKGLTLESYQKNLQQHIGSIFSSASTITSSPCSYENLSLDFVLRHPDQPWHWKSLSYHEHIPVDQILEHPELPWSYSEFGVSTHPGLRLDHVLNHPEIPWQRSVVFGHTLPPSATFDQIMATPDEPWSAKCLASPNISCKQQLLDVLVPFFKDKVLDDDRAIWQHLCTNKHLTFRDLYAFFCRGVLDISRDDAFGLLCNPNITTTDLADFPDEKWRYDFLSSVLPADYLIANRKLNWNWQVFLQYNKGATCEILEQLPSDCNCGAYWYHPNPRYWMWASLFSNQHASRRDKERCMREILQDGTHSNMCHYMPVVASPLFLQPTLEESVEALKIHLAKRRIVRIVVQALTDPAYAQCRRRLLRESARLHADFSC